MTHNHFESELLQGEKILWQGQPDPSVRFTTSDLFMVPFSLLWGGFALFWEGSALLETANAPQPVGIIFPLFGIPFVLMGLYFVFGRFWYKAAKKKKTYYAVTDKRVLILTEFGRRQFQAAFISTLPVINKTVGSNGTGTLVFGNMNMTASMYANTGMDFFAGFSGGGVAPAFYDVKDAEAVYQQVSNLRNG